MTPVNNRLQQKSISFRGVKTQDNVFTDLGIDIQYRIKSEDTEKAFFSLDDPVAQMEAYVKNVVRSRVPNLKLDDLFESQNDISSAIEDRLAARMKVHGFTIVSTLLTEINPERSVMDAMNRINASERLKDAAKNEAEAEYIKQVRNAEADRDRKRLQGEGMAQQRIEIMKGYETGVSAMADNFGMDHQTIVDFVLKTQHLDTMESIGKTDNTKTLFLNHSLDSNPFFNNLQATKETQ